MLLVLKPTSNSILILTNILEYLETVNTTNDDMPAEHCHWSVMDIVLNDIAVDICICF